MVEQGLSDSIIVVNPMAILREQWKNVAREVGFNLCTDIKKYDRTQHHGLSLTTQYVTENVRSILDSTEDTNWFAIVDESDMNRSTIDRISEDFLRTNDRNRFLLLASTLPSAKDTFDAQFRFNMEYLFQASIIQRAETKIELARYSPSSSILQRLFARKVQIDDLNWREFERLVSELLEQDGYEVELLRGTKDGGVDVVAVKDMGTAGFFKTVWQAKKKDLKNKVGLSIVRELADTRSEFKASKGMIVTSTYLTRGALARIERDKYILGKVDRDDLSAWIQRILFGANK